ncbi:hypothetical protein HS121_17700 [bacterium]|nr:hypothetical protein [bacterium]
MNFGSAIHEAFLKSRFVDRMKFTIMWENQSRGTSGVSDEKISWTTCCRSGWKITSGTPVI